MTLHAVEIEEIALDRDLAEAETIAALIRGGGALEGRVEEVKVRRLGRPELDLLGLPGRLVDEVGVLAGLDGDRVRGQREDGVV